MAKATWNRRRTRAVKRPRILPDGPILQEGNRHGVGLWPPGPSGDNS